MSSTGCYKVATIGIKTVYSKKINIFIYFIIFLLYSKNKIYDYRYNYIFSYIFMYYISQRIIV